MDTYKKFLKPVIIVVAVLATFCLVLMINTYESAADKADQLSDNLTYFSDFELKGIDGERFTQDDLKGFKVTVINGWAPWCGPCTNEIPHLDALNEDYKAKGLQVVGVVADYYPNHVNGEADGYNEQIRNVISSTGCKYPNLVSDETFYKNVYPTTKNAFPCTWAVDENGNVIEIVHGAKSAEDWRAFFDKWLAGR